MAIRIPVILRKGQVEVRVKALLNTGFETDEPVVVVPYDIALNLGLKPSSKTTYLGPGSIIGEAYLAGEVEVIVESDNIRRSVKAYAVIEPKESEVVLSDKAIAELGIVIDLKNSKWWLT